MMLSCVPLGKSFQNARIAGHADLQVLISFRILLGIAQDGVVDHVELDVGNRPLVEPLAQIGGKQLLILAFQEGGHETLVEEVHVQERNLGRGVQHGRGAVVVGAAAGDRLPSVSVLVAFRPSGVGPQASPAV